MTGLRVFSWVVLVAFACIAFAQESGNVQEAKKDDGRADVPLVTFRGHANEVTALAFAPDGNQIVSASAQEICIWDATTGKETRRLAADNEIVVAFRRDLSRLAIARSFRASGGIFGKLTIQDAANGKEILSIDPHGDWDRGFPFRPAVAALDFSPDGKQLATAGSITKVGGPHGLPGGIVKIWDAETGKEFQQLGPLSTRADAVVFSADGKYLAAGTQGASGELPEPGEVLVWDAATGRRLQSFKTKREIQPGGDSCSVVCLSFHPNGRQLAAALSDGTVRLWDLTSGRETLTLRGHQGQGGDREIDRFTGRIMGPGRSVRSVAFSPDGSQLASAGYDRVVRIWDAESGKETNTLRFDSARINALAFSPDGQRLAAGGSDAAKSGAVVIWQLSDKLEKPGGADLPIRPRTATENAESEAKRRMADALLKAEDKRWQDLDAPQRGIKDRVFKILAKTPMLSDQQVASAVYLLTVGRLPTDEEAQGAQQQFAETDFRQLSVLQLSRVLVQSKEFSAGVAGTNSQLFKTQTYLATEPGTGERVRWLNGDEFQKLIGESAAAVEKTVKTDPQLVDLAFLLVLSRYPTAVESEQLAAHQRKAGDRATATKDIFWFLLNSKEFLATQ